MRLILAATTIALALTGCIVVPLPDGSKVSRLPEVSAPAPAPVLTPEERARYDEVDRQAQREQQAARDAERRAQEAEAHRRAAPPPPDYYYYGYGWPYFGWSLNWHWSGRHWGRHPRWGLGIHIWP